MPNGYILKAVDIKANKRHRTAIAYQVCSELFRKETTDYEPYKIGFGENNLVLVVRLNYGK